VYVQPNFAFQFAPGWSVGGGPVFGYSHVVLRQSLDLSEQSVAPNVTFGMLGIPRGTDFGRAKLSGNATAWGFNVGVHGTFASDWQVGARYLARLNFNYHRADATFVQTPTGLTLAANNPLGAPAGTPVDALLAPSFAAGGRLVSQGVSTRVRHPSQLQVGLGYTGFTNTTLSADLAWIDYSVFDRLPVDFHGPATDRTLLEDWRDSWSVRLGLERAFAIGVKGRAGFSWAGTPVPAADVTPLLPDQDRRNYSVGVGMPLGTTFTVDAGYLRVDTSGRRGTLVQRTSEGQTATQLSSGFYTFGANIFSLSVRANF
jgi:long-chain fatty acid transport protein